MKKLILIYLLVLGTLVEVKAQQIPLYSQYYYNPFLYNPAMAGYNPTGNIFLIDRTQWTGIPGAPVTRALTIEGPINSKKVGLGLSIYDDQTDIFEHMGVYGSYAYNIRFSEDNELRLGLAAGFINNRIDFDKVTVKDPRDNAILTHFEDRQTFDATFGIAYHYHDLLVGVSVPQLLAPKLTYMENSNMMIYYSLVRHFIGSATYTFHVSDDKFRIQPMVYAQFAQGAPLSLDAGVNVKYKDIAWIGLLWRKDFAVSASVGIKIHDRITLGYAYDWMTSAISPYAGNTHELIVGYSFGKAAASKNHEDEINKRLKEINDRVDNNQKTTKVTDDSLRNELKRANRKIEKQDSVISSEHRSFDDFKRDMLDSMGNLKSNMKTGPNSSPKSEVVDRTSSNKTATSTDFPGYVLNNINFGNEDANLTSSSNGQLDELAQILKNNPKMKIEIDGYCDYRGTEAFNMKLSKERSAAVKKYLISHGVGKGQVTTKGFGKSKPVADNSTPEGMAKNRRVELKVLTK
jgi:type IX secretion system PorP/SprF family membrane protein